MTKGQLQSFGLFQFMILAFVAVVLFGGLIYAMGLINDVFDDVGINNEANSGMPGYVNMTQAADVTFGQANQGVQSLRLVAFSLIFATIISFIFTSAMIKVHPVFFFAHILLTMLAVFLSVPISNAYENIMMSNIYEGNLTTFTGANYVILNLPIFVTALGLIGGIFMFVGLIRPQGGLG